MLICSGCLSRQSLSINIIDMSEKCRLSLLKKDIYNTVYLYTRLLWMKIVWNLPNLWNWLLRIWIYPCNACRMTSVQFDLPWTNIPFSLEYHHLPFFCWRGTFLRFYTTHHICFLKLLSHISTCLMTKCLVLMYLDGVYLRRQLFFYWISKKEALSFLPSPIVAAALVLSSYSETTAHYHCYSGGTLGIWDWCSTEATRVSQRSREIGVAYTVGLNQELFGTLGKKARSPEGQKSRNPEGQKPWSP